jgi:excisionase family DNA binding protein
MDTEGFFQKPRSIQEVADYFDVSLRFLTAEISRGNLAAVRLSHSVVRITPEAIRAWMALPFDQRVKGAK